ncbi:hypothetical protein BT67DRAFT_439290 [Trichocladium antarcticum]|uniref:Uncharacterized protein n=1 Tax=Trichocladium antarcticum TaxID=1450529 RepID=A0AAN6ZHI0_9PEZI|nr:hypothetical protein BT67DRAFT_439290 [Trichocladium antarcticum]
MGQWQFGGLFSVAACQGCSLVEPGAGRLTACTVHSMRSRARTPGPRRATSVSYPLARMNPAGGKVVRCDFQQSSPDLGHGWVFRGQWQNAPIVCPARNHFRSYITAHAIALCAGLARRCLDRLCLPPPALASSTGKLNGMENEEENDERYKRNKIA